MLGLKERKINMDVTNVVSSLVSFLPFSQPAVVSCLLRLA